MVGPVGRSCPVGVHHGGDFVAHGADEGCGVDLESDRFPVGVGAGGDARTLHGRDPASRAGTLGELFLERVGMRVVGNEEDLHADAVGGP